MIELQVSTGSPIDGQLLRNTLFRIHEYINNVIGEQGEGPLAPKDDPFGWKSSSSPSTTPSVSLTAHSAAGEQMTWGLLLFVVEGLYLCLPAVGRDMGAQFNIWDSRYQAMWGFGELRAVRQIPS